MPVAAGPSAARLRVLLVGILLLQVLVWAAEEEDYYTLLGVSRDATTRQIRKAFKKLALTIHPDKNPVSIRRWQWHSITWSPKY